ncbi:hypothetical protein GA0070563_1493, partial [Micromonospora carbonacea]
EIGVATAWRYVQEAIALLSAAAEELDYGSCPLVLDT